MTLSDKVFLPVRLKNLDTGVGIYPKLCIKPNYVGFMLNIHGGNNIKPNLLIKYNKNTLGFKKDPTQSYLILGRDFYENTKKAGLTVNTCFPITGNKQEFFNACEVGFEAKTNLSKKTVVRQSEIGFKGEISAGIFSITKNGVKRNTPVKNINLENNSLRSENINSENVFLRPQTASILPEQFNNINTESDLLCSEKSNSENVFLQQATRSLPPDYYFQNQKIDTYNHASLAGSNIIGLVGGLILYRTFNFIKKNFLNG